MKASETGYIVVDASVWVARLVPQDVFHSTVRDWMETQRLAGQVFISPTLLLPEVAGAISRRAGDTRLARRTINTLIDLPGLRLVALDQPLIVEAAQLSADLGLRGADSVYVAAAIRLRLPLVTLDHDQKERARSVIVVQEVAE